ncbi:peptide chain release factor 1-like, mitochondrial [Microplitis mediator]|uniref:peptide chain release factor 1-like, mitochondrial n=1 Tax=Microplitis mediator TaxID=375433 RepID=UPI0025576FCF|nr:peptide chain release factor 1-like, mitochondrial [Microplitis mediator]XP_057337284.1 peptide chain release factor 1-like, mitochondrial [Microplitis mediator]
MLFFARGWRFGGRCCRDIVEFNNFRIKLNINLNDRRILGCNNFCTKLDISVTDKNVKKYIKSITKAYKYKSKDDELLTSIVSTREVVTMLDNRLHIEENIKSLEELGQNDEEMKKLGQEEYADYQETLNRLDEELIEAIADHVGRDNCRDIIFEITAGVGGQEAMLFAADLLNMYQGYFEYLGFTQQQLDIDKETGIGGMRHASILVSGDGAYELLRHEGGVHRVQRIPATERAGRMHTSTVTVAVLPQPTELEVNLMDKDLKIETKRSSGAGGQSVNKTESAVRIVHLPTGIAVEAQSQRTQIQNKQIALLKLRTKIYDMQLNEQKSTSDAMRRKQRGMSQRNEKIRTYNFSQDRITDHRISNGTMHNLKGFMEGGEGLESLQKILQRNFQLKLLQEAIDKCK